MSPSCARRSARHEPERNFGSLLERARRGETLQQLHLNLHGGADYLFTDLEDIRDALANNRPLDEVQREVLLSIIDGYTLARPEGRRPAMGLALREASARHRQASLPRGAGA